MRLRPLRRQKGWNEILTQCPICGKSGWCAINDDQDIVHCMRFASDDYLESSIGRQYVHYLDPNHFSKVDVEIVHADSTEKRTDDHLDVVYRTMIEEMKLSEAHLYHLRNVRHFSDNEIVLRQYRTMPAADRYKIANNLLIRLEEPSALLGVPGFFTQSGRHGDYWSMSGLTGLMIPFHSIKNEITGWQIRVDEPPLELKMEGAIKGEVIKELEPSQWGMRRARCRIHVQEKTLEVILTEKDEKVCYSKSGQFVFRVELKEGNRYWWWSSGSKDNGSSIGAPLPYHLALPSPVLQHWSIGETPDAIIDCSEVWITEGPIKADKAAEALGKPVFGLPGIGTYSLVLEPLKQLGCKHIVIAYDADLIVKPEVQQTLENCAEFFAKHTNMSMSLALWDLSLGKGIDNLLDEGYVPQLSLMID